MSIPINLLIEDELHLNVLTKALGFVGRGYTIDRVFGRKGKDYIRKHLSAYNEAAKLKPCLALVDLDRADCPLTIINGWLTFTKSANLIFRIAVREAEAWLISDRKNFAAFMGVPKDIIDPKPESIPDPKEYIIYLAGRSRKRKIREDLVPEGKATVGRNYNTCLADFVLNHWDVSRAMVNSKSLAHMVKTLNNF
jgi:hypothetical protein